MCQICSPHTHLGAVQDLFQIPAGISILSVIAKAAALVVKRADLLVGLRAAVKAALRAEMRADSMVGLRVV